MQFWPPLQDDGIPFHYSPTALVFSLVLHTYIYTNMGFELSPSKKGIFGSSPLNKYANTVCVCVCVLNSHTVC